MCKNSSAAPRARGQAYSKSFKICTDEHYLVQNRTPRVVQIDGGEYGEMLLAPLAQRVVTGERLLPFEEKLRPYRQRHEVRVRQQTSVPKAEGFGLWTAVIAVCIAVLLGLAGTAAIAYDVFVMGTLATWEAASAVAALLLVVAVVISRSVLRERKRIQTEREVDEEEGDIEFGVGDTFYDGNETARRTKQVFTLAMVVLIGAVLPAIAIFVATDAKDFLNLQGGLTVRDGLESRLVSRILVVVYTAVLVLFPALMYFQFDQQRVGAIRGKWVRAIFRMDKQMKTLADVDARYGDQLGEASSYSTDSVRFLGGRHSPIIIATILISVGWTVLVLRTDSYDFDGATEISALVTTADDAAQRTRATADENDGDDLEARAEAVESAVAEAARASAAVQAIVTQSTGEPEPGAAAVNGPTVSPKEQSIDAAATAADAEADEAHAAADSVQQPYFQLLVPTPSIATMAFLGAYFYAVYLVLRSYFSGDLRPRLYNQITARLVTVVILAYLLNVVLAPESQGSAAMLTLAFAAGVVPSTALRRIGDLRSSFFIRAADRAAGRAADQHGDAGSKGRHGFWGALADAFATKRPLTQVEGIDIYESARLESDGVGDIPALAKSDLVALMVNTRLPVERLVDWTDQAMLILLLDDDREDEPSKKVKDLRKLGIRTASCLSDVAKRPNTDGLRQAVERVLKDGETSGSDLLHGMVMQIDQEPSIRRVRNWYAAEFECVCEDDRDDPPGNGAADTAPHPVAA
jgi:hypothetical protein